MATRTTKHLDRVAAPGLKPDGLLSLILREINGDMDVVPPDFKTSGQYARDWRMSIRRAQELLKTATEMGVVERKDFKVLSGNRRVSVPHYRAMKKG